MQSGVIIHTYAEKSATLFNIVEQIFCPRGGMVDTRDLKSLAFGRAGSSPARGTIIFDSNMHQIRFGILSIFFLFDKNVTHIDLQELNYDFLPVESMTVCLNNC